MSRGALSRPVALAFEHGILEAASTVLDYGCGRGGDVLRLRSLGFECGGWDPTYFPDEPRREADVVNLGYVVNVIENPRERSEALRSAWQLAREVLIVSARLAWEDAALPGTRFSDGVLTGRGTFQKLFTQEELREWVDAQLDARSVAAAPGIFYVFRQEERAQRFLASRYRRRLATPTPRVRQALFDTHRELLQPLIAFLTERGRLPDRTEFAGAEIQDVFGSLRRAYQVVREVTGPEQWEHIRAERQQDLLVYIALSRFGGRPILSQLPAEIYFDVKAHFGTYKAACTEADKLLFQAGDLEAIGAACEDAPVGKRTPAGLYIHTTALDTLPPLLRVYEGCARYLTGTIQAANLIKLNRLKPQISYLVYPQFDRDPHPRLAYSVRASLRHLHVRYRDFRKSTNPPLLHRKETFVQPEYPKFATFQRLTRQEERWGVLSESHRIGTRDGWQQVLAEHGASLLGHRLVRPRASPGQAEIG